MTNESHLSVAAKLVYKFKKVPKKWFFGDLLVSVFSCWLNYRVKKFPVKRLNIGREKQVFSSHNLNLS